MHDVVVPPFLFAMRVPDVVLRRTKTLAGEEEGEAVTIRCRE